MPRHFRRTSQGKLRLSGVMGGRGSLVSPTVVPAELQRTASTQSAAPSLRRQNTRRNSGRVRRLSLIRAFGKTPAESIDYEEPLTFAARAILQDTQELTRARRERLFMPIVIVLVRSAPARVRRARAPLAPHRRAYVRGGARARRWARWRG